MNFAQWAAIIGLPTILAGAIVAFVKFIVAQLSSMRYGVQALLRAQMITDYNKYSEQGYAPIYARENFENCWKRYHGLGANGVMDDLHTKFLALPTEPPSTKKGVKPNDK